MYSIFQPGSIIKINNYEFQDGGGTRDKYLIVLFSEGDEAYIIHTLTTTNNKFGVDVSSMNFGCSILNSKIPVFFFPRHIKVGCESGFYFDDDTFIFFNNNIRKESLKKFDVYLNQRSLEICRLDSLSYYDLKRLLKCVLKSKTIPTGLKTLIENYKDEIAN